MEARIAGVNLPVQKHVCIALTSIYGVGRSRANDICKLANVKPDKKVLALADNELEALRIQVNTFIIEGELRREVSMNIKRKIDIGSYEGLRHRRGLPLKQRTRTNARTRKGKRKGKVNK